MSKKIAEERIRRLFELADKRVEEGESQLADRYVELARKIGMGETIPIPSELRKSICGSCHSYISPGYNCEVKIDSKNSRIQYKCQKCGNKDFYGYKE